MHSDTRREVVLGLVALGLVALERLHEAIVNQGFAYARIGRIALPFLAVPVLHLPGVQIMVHVQLGRAGPDVYVWDRGHRRHPVRDVCGAAARLLAEVRTGGGE